MPLLQINSTNKEIDQSTLSELHLSGARILAEEIGKSTDYVMVIINPGRSMSFALDINTPCAYLEVKNVGTLTAEKTQRISQLLTTLVTEKLGTVASRTYIEFQESDRHHWGWNGATFA
mgnify:CR=1 FL=1